MRENKIEQAFVLVVKSLGGIALKNANVYRAGFPDRTAILPSGVSVFVELKAPSKKPTPLQIKRHKELRELGYRVYVIDSLDAVNDFRLKEEQWKNLVRTPIRQ